MGNFSGGEQARLALALVAWQKPNLLLLDEPDDYRKLLLEKRAAPATDVATDETTARVDRRDERRLAAEKRERLRPLRNRITSLEKDMEKLQAELRHLDERLQDPGLYESARAGEVQDLLRRQGALKQELATVEEAWLMACEELEAL